MNLYILDPSLRAIKLYDSYQSLIWTDRYDECGDFEIVAPITEDVFEYMRQGYYISRPDTDRVMIIETIQISVDVEDGPSLIISGRSLESILDRRIVWNYTSLVGANLQDAVEQLLNENLICPTDENRKIENFIFEKSEDPAVMELEIDIQYHGENLYEVIESICTERNLGFQIVMDESGRFIFSLYAGTDRSYNQVANTYVVFSPRYDNLISSNYMESNKSWKNVTLVGGEGEGAERTCVEVGEASGLTRRETFTDAGDTSRSSGDAIYSTEEYRAVLVQKGKEDLTNYQDISSFEGEADPVLMYEYGKDYFIGDIVQIADDYGHEAVARVTEIVTSEDETGFKIYPTFETVIFTTDMNTVVSEEMSVIKVLTEAEFDTLANKDSGTLYFILDEGG